MEVVEKDLSIQQSKSNLVFTDDYNIADLSLQLIIEEFDYMEILE